MDLLRDHPDMGRPGYIEGTRELAIPRLPYYAAYGAVFLGEAKNANLGVGVEQHSCLHKTVPKR
jgi:hypothetical protein